jgi:hypothetical protein
VKIDPLMLLGLITLGMTLGALLLMIRYKSALAKIVSEQINKEQKQSDLSATKNADSKRNEAA